MSQVKARKKRNGKRKEGKIDPKLSNERQTELERRRSVQN